MDLGPRLSDCSLYLDDHFGVVLLAIARPKHRTVLGRTRSCRSDRRLRTFVPRECTCRSQRRRIRGRVRSGCIPSCASRSGDAERNHPGKYHEGEREDRDRSPLVTPHRSVRITAVALSDGSGNKAPTSGRSVCDT